MATSGVTTGIATAGDAVNMAAELIGLRAGSDPLDAADAQTALRHLNWMLKSWQANGANLWLREAITITWPAATEEVVLDTNYLVIENAFIRTAGIDRQLSFYSADEYAAIPNKSQAGSPLLFTVQKTTTTQRLRIWMVPTTSVDFHADGRRVIEDVATLTQNLDIPQEWTECVAYNLAKRMLLVFPGTDPATAKSIRDEADNLMGSMMVFGAQGGSMFFMPA